MKNIYNFNTNKILASNLKIYEMIEIHETCKIARLFSRFSTMLYLKFGMIPRRLCYIL